MVEGARCHCVIEQKPEDYGFVFPDGSFSDTQRGDAVARATAP